jgi:hypothetical protein
LSELLLYWDGAPGFAVQAGSPVDTELT